MFIGFLGWVVGGTLAMLCVISILHDSFPASTYSQFLQSVEQMKSPRKLLFCGLVFGPLGIAMLGLYVAWQILLLVVRELR
jgi:hypothetical protein